MASPDPDIRRAVAGKANAARLSRLDAEGRRALTVAARAAMHQRDLDQADREAEAWGVVLDADEREYRASQIRRMRLADLQLKAVKARKAKADVARAVDREAAKAAARDALLAALADLEDGDL